MNDPVSGRPSQKKDSPSGAELIGLGGLLAAAVIIPLIAGLGLDGVMHHSPVGVLGGLLIGIVAASWVVYTRFKQYW